MMAFPRKAILSQRSFLHFGAPDVSGKLRETDQDLVTTDEQIHVAERQQDWRQTQRVKMRYAESRAGRMVGFVKPLRPNAAMAVAGGCKIDQLPVRGPLGRGVL